MNPYQILELILEALADGRQEGESIKDFKKRKADELEQRFAGQVRQAHQEEKAAAKKAKQAKVDYEQNPSSETGQHMVDTAIKALDKSLKSSDVERKEYNARRIKNKMSNEALEILEDIYSAINKRYPKNSERNKELKDSAYKSKTDAEEVAKQHELGKRPEPAPIKGGWDIMSVEIPDETPEEKEYAKKEWKYDLKQMKKDITKNKAGEHETSKKQFPKSYKNVGTLGEPDAKELETERIARKAAGKRKAKMNKNEALEIMEDIHAAIEKHAHEIKKPRLHRDAIGNYVDELVGVAKNNLPDEKKHLMSATNDEMNKIEGKRTSTKNKKGERKTDLRSASTKGGDYWRVKDQRKEDAAKGYPKAIEKSVKRHEKKMSEALEIMEEIINEVSLGKLKKTAEKVFPKRQAQANKSAEANVKNWADYEEQVKKSPEDEPQLFKKALANDVAAYDDRKGAEHAAKIMYNVPDSKHSANKYFKAAQNSKGGSNRSKAHYAEHMASMDPVKSRANEALEIMEQICDFADNLFELDYEEKQNISPNKISRTKKDKDGEKVEVVSVADELFPYSGSAKEQFNKKVLAKINDMIEGTGSLEDLIQFVRAGVKNRAHESIQEEKKEPNAECEYRKGEWDKAVQNYYDTKKKNMDFEGKHPETKKAYDEERKAYVNLDKARRDSKKINGPYEALEKIKNVAEGLFKKDERGDLLNDIDTALGSPVKKKFADIKAKMTGCKQTKVHEALDLMEEIINELDYNFVSKQKASADRTLAKKEKEALRKEGKEKEEALDDIAKYQHKINTSLNHVENKRIKEIKAEEEERNKKKNK